MIFTILATVRGFLAKVPWQAWVALAIVGTAWLWGNHRYQQGYDARSAEYDAAALETAQEARKADAVGQTTAEAKKSTVEAGNQAAREAAQDSADPLKSALDDLGGR